MKETRIQNEDKNWATVSRKKKEKKNIYKGEVFLFEMRNN